MHKLLLTAALAVTIGAGTLAATTTPSEAAVVCNRYGDCWRTNARHTYRPSWGLSVYADNWRWQARDNRKYRWREARGPRGYYGPNGIWLRF